MATDVLWLDQAMDDVRELLDYLSAENPAAAIKYIDELEQACMRSTEFSERGRRYNAQYRALVVHSHLVFYRHDRDLCQVVIAAVIDGRRDLPRLLDTDTTN